MGLFVLNAAADLKCNSGMRLARKFPNFTTVEESFLLTGQKGQRHRTSQWCPMLGAVTRAIRSRITMRMEWSWSPVLQDTTPSMVQIKLTWPRLNISERRAIS